MDTPRPLLAGNFRFAAGPPARTRAQTRAQDRRRSDRGLARPVPPAGALEELEEEELEEELNGEEKERDEVTAAELAEGLLAAR